MSHRDRAIHGEIILNASVEDVWKCWTTETGLKSFFAPGCKLQLEVGGAFEIYFNPDAEPGLKGAVGTRILAIQEHKMLSFTWNSPPHLATVRNQYTLVVIRFEQESDVRTKLTLHHCGWGSGGDWDLSFDYFTSAWLKVVLPRLKYRFDHGPVNWENPLSP